MAQNAMHGVRNNHGAGTRFYILREKFIKIKFA